jgi:hypothetical protein
MSSTPSDWPTPEPLNGDEVKALFQAKLDAHLKSLDARAASAAAKDAVDDDIREKQIDDDIARSAAERAAEIANKTAYEQALLDVAKGTLDRARANADLVQKASSALVALYTGALALAFSVADHPLPLRGLIPAILLGLSVVASTAYLAYVTDPRKVQGPSATSSLREMANRRIAAFIIWTRAAAFARVYWLRVSVLALAASLAFMPAPFIAGSGNVEATAITPATAWPPVPTQTDELNKILYQAKVTEVADLRKDEVTSAERRSSTSSGNQRAWWIAFAVALLVIFSVPWLRLPGQTQPTVSDAQEAV